MPRGKRQLVKDGQVDVFGVIHGLENLVKPPEVIESEGLKVIHFAVSEDDRTTPGYIDIVKEKARRLLPETKSVGKPPWANAAWQAKRRKKKAGVL